jgi:hypothetical protein
MRTPHQLPRPSLRRRIEQALAANPLGLGWRELRDQLAVRAVALGEQPPHAEQIVRQLGALLVEGRADERNGRWVLLPADARPASAPLHQAA